MTKYLRVLAALAMAAATALLFGTPGQAAPCQRNCLQPGDYTIVTISNLLPRSYIVHVPSSYTGAEDVPLLLDIHGFSSYAADERKWSGHLEESDRRGFIAVWPDGIGLSWNAYGCCAAGNAAQLNDVAFLRQVIAEMKGRANIDDNRVFVTGISNGGGMAQRMACEAADVVRAVAAVAFPLNTNSCNPAKPISVTAIHGTADKTISYYGNPPPLPILPYTLAGIPLGVQGARESLAEWKRINGCSDELSRTQLLDDVRVEEYRSCNQGVRAGLVTIIGGPHVLYDGYTGPLGGTPYAAPIETAPYIWDNIFNI